MPPLPEAIILVLTPFAPLCSPRVWRHAQLLRLGAILTPGARTVTAASRATGLATERRFTDYHRGLNRATWSARQGRRILLSLLVALWVPPEATVVLGVDDTVDRRSGRKITANGCYRDAVRSAKSQVIRCVGLKWVSMRLLVAVPWSQRVWAVPCLAALGWPANTHGPHRHKTSIDWGRQMMKPVRRWLPERRLVVVGDGGFAAVSLALACVKSRVARVSRLRGAAALSPPPAPPPPGTRGRKPANGRRQRSVQAGASRPDTPWEDVEVAWCGGQRQQLWVFSHTALWDTPGLPPVAIRSVLVADPEGKLRMEAFSCPDLKATPAHIRAWVVMRWSVEVTCEEARAPLGWETQRPWSDHAIARTTPVVLGLCSIVTMLALRLREAGHIPVPMTAWYHKTEPTFADCVALVRPPLWRARFFVNATAEPEFGQFPREAFERWLTGLSLAA
jgi:DDE superfamily endonuclease